MHIIPYDTRKVYMIHAHTSCITKFFFTYFKLFYKIKHTHYIFYKISYFKKIKIQCCFTIVGLKILFLK